MLDAMDRGGVNDCGVAVLTALEWEEFEGKGEHCDKFMLDQTVFTFPNSFPVLREDLRQALSWAMTEKLVEGSFEQLTNTWKNKGGQLSACTDQGGEKSSAYSDIMFPFWISMIGSAVGLLYFLFNDWRYSRADHKKNKPGRFHLRPPSVKERFFHGKHWDAVPDKLSAVVRDNCHIEQDRSDLLIIDGVLKNRRALEVEVGMALKVESPLTIGDLPTMIALIRGMPLIDNPMLRSDGANVTKSPSKKSRQSAGSFMGAISEDEGGLDVDRAGTVTNV
jgi:hypothetical protein